MKFFERISPEWPLRLGLGLMYLYSGYKLFYFPQNWYGFVPQWFSQTVTSVISINTYLRFQGIAEFIIGLLFLSWFSGMRGIQLAALFAIGEFLLILIFVGIDLITFRDIGLLGAATTLLIIIRQEQNKNKILLPKQGESPSAA